MRKSIFTVKVLALIILFSIGSCGKGDSDKTKATDLPAAGGVVGEVIAVVSAGKGQDAGVRLMKPGASVWREIKTGQQIWAGDHLSVEDQANAMIHMKSGEEIALNSGTKMKFSSPTSIDLEQGELWINTSLSGGAEKLSVKTREGDVTVEGTIANLRLKNKVLRVSVISGKARIVGERGDIEIHGGEEALMEPEEEVSVEPIRDAGILAAWTEAVRREIKRGLTKEGEETAEVPRGLGTLTARVPGGKKDLPFKILKQHVSITVQDQIALTKVEQVFQNPTKSTVEGTYKFPIPHGARMNRYDMEIKGKLMAGEIVERQRGRVIMQTVIKQFLDMMRDPALVEWESGSTFKTRIFPILGKQKKRIVLSYIQTLDGEGGKYRYVLPVATPGALAPEIPDVKIHAKVSSTTGSPVINTPLYPAATKASNGKVEIDFEAKDFSPVVDFVIDVDHEKRPEADLVTFGTKSKDKEGEEVRTLLQKLKAQGGEEGKWDYFLMSVRPEFKASVEKKDDVQNWIFMVDTSQSRTILDMEVQKKLLEATIANLSREDRMKVMAYDAGARVMSSDWGLPSKSYIEETARFIDALPAAGATNIEGALLEAAKELEGTRGAKIVLIGDGAATLGENRAKELSQWAGELFNETRASVTTVGIGSSIDNLLLEDLSARTGGKFYYLSSGEDLLTSAVKIISSLRTPILRDVEVTFEGLEVKDVYPSKIPNVGSGQEIVVTGRYKGTGELDVTLSGNVGDKEHEKTYSFDVGEGKEANTFVPIIWASRKIDSLTLEGGEEMKKDIIALSKKYSLPSRYTSFIVLESEAMYKEFGVQRDKDRFEWEGEDIEYEEAVDEEGEDMEEATRAMLLDQLSTSGITGTLGSAGSAKGGAVSGKAADLDYAPKSEAAPAAAKAMEKKAKASSMTKKPPAKSAPPKMKKSADPLSGMMDDGFGGGGGGYYDYYHPRPRTVADIKTLPLDVSSAKKGKVIAELKEAVKNEPLLRTHRKKLIHFLMSVGEYDEAFAETKAWYAMDSGNQDAMTTMGDLLRLKGDLFGAVRYYSGILDVSPEKTKLMEKLAGYFESREQWEQAYPYRVSRSLVKPTDKKAAAARAIAAARVGRWDDAMRAVKDLFTEDSKGEMKMKKGVKLPADMREMLKKVAATEKSPLLFELPGSTSVKGAKFIAELTWEKPVDLDLWVLSPKGEFLGSGGDKGNILVGESGGEGEVFFMPKPKKGKYKVQVACGEARGCGNLVGKVKITAFGKSKTVSFVIEEGWGTDVATVRVKTAYY